MVQRKRGVVEGRTRNIRKTRRQQLGKLRDLVIKPATKSRYKSAMRLFFEFLRWNRLPMPTDATQVDRVAAQYIQECWEEGESKYIAQDTLSALQHFEPQLKRRLLESWRLIRAWQQHEIPTRAPPLTPVTLALLAGWFQQHFPELGLGLLVAFHGLLRTGELFSIQAKHIICTGDLCLLHLGPTKMGARNASTETASFRHRQVSLLLQAWKTVHRPDAFLVSVSPTSFRQWFARALIATDLHHVPYKPYSLRRGGATQVFLETQSYATVCQRGRWSSERTTRVYIQDSVALLTELSFRPTVKQQALLQLWTATLSKLEPTRKTGSRGGRGRK